jgi:hypothetical protein
MLETKSKPTNDNRLYKLQECGDSLEYKAMVDKWRCSNGLEPLYSVEKEKQVVSIG